MIRQYSSRFGREREEGTHAVERTVEGGYGTEESATSLDSFAQLVEGRDSRSPVDARVRDGLSVRESRRTRRRDRLLAF